MRLSKPVYTAALLALAAGCNLTNGNQTNVPPGLGCLNPKSCSVGEVLNPPEQLVGERLFKDTRFGHYFATESGGAVNSTLGTGEPVVETELTTDPNQPLPDPMAGQAINCLQCHLVQQEINEPNGGMHAYTDFARRSSIPSRTEDTVHSGFTPRKAAPMVDDFNTGSVDQCLHWDCQFGDIQSLIYDTLKGRNFGWLPTEGTQAEHQIATVVREDNGKDELAKEFSNSLPYATLFACADTQIPAAYQLPKQYCLDPKTASDDDITEDVAALIATYANSLAFSRDDDDNFNGSPFDAFLSVNGLPQQPAAGQTPAQYAAALLQKLLSRSDFTFVNDGVLRFQHNQPFVFGAQELHGLIIFLSRPAGSTPSPAEIGAGGIGSCAACHALPDFTDHLMHNSGISQTEYDAVHGSGTFMHLAVPNLAQRSADPDAYLPATPQHPTAQEVFRMAPVASDAQKADLGVWNIFANADFSDREASLRKFLCAVSTGTFATCSLSDDQLLSTALAVFKTRTVRDMGQSGPFMHNGQFDTLQDVLKFYEKAGAQARAGQLRNADPRMQAIALTDANLADLAAFLNSLNEDYSN
jgi:hypothetical protein